MAADDWVLCLLPHSEAPKKKKKKQEEKKRIKESALARCWRLGLALLVVRGGSFVLSLVVSC
jgi:hypothetical protein